MADLALGVIEIFSTCIRGYTIVTDALDVPEEQRRLYHSMRCQRARVVVWGENWGIDEHTADQERRSSRYSGAEKLQAYLRSGVKLGPQILDVLNAIAQLFVDQIRLQEVYGLAKIGEARDMSELQDLDIVDLIHGVSRLPISKARLDKSRQGINYLGRCDWVIRDPPAFESLLLTLRNLNDDLYGLCPPAAREMMDRALVSELLAGLRDVRELLHLHNAAVDDAVDTRGPSKDFYSPGYKTLSQAAKLRARGNINPFLKRRLIKAPVTLTRKDYQLHASVAWHGGDACLAVTQSQRRVVLVEFKSYVVDGHAHRSLEDTVHKLAELLCADDKPSEFRLLPCSGYFHDPAEGRYGFVYELPTYLHIRHPAEIQQGGLSLRKPHSLMALLRQLRDPIDLGTRFQIAKQLVASMYMIHASGFMHRNIRPSSILFLPAESADRSGGPSKSLRVALGKPFLMGWGFTRPDDIELEPIAAGDRRIVATRDKEFGIYQHPERLKYPNKAYRHSYDIYSLGLVLLEIGLWQSVESFVAGITDFTTDEFRGFLRKRVLPDLRGQCGGVYEGVVQECLGLRTDLETEEAVEKTLCWDIAGRIWACHA